MLISYACVSVRVSCQVQTRRLTTRQRRHRRLDCVNEFTEDETLFSKGHHIVTSHGVDGRRPKGLYLSEKNTL